jgi:hypothetical protein
MQIAITEKQLRNILSKQLMKEQTPSTAPETTSAPEASTPTPDASSSSSSGGSTSSGSSNSASSYPSVEKWESGATRGPANQVAVTKWSDIVGGSIKRGKANPLT